MNHVPDIATTATIRGGRLDGATCPIVSTADTELTLIAYKRPAGELLVDLRARMSRAAVASLLRQLADRYSAPA